MLDCDYTLILFAFITQKTVVVTFANCKLEALKYDNEPSDRPTEYDWVVKGDNSAGMDKGTVGGI